MMELELRQKSGYKQKKRKLKDKKVIKYVKNVQIEHEKLKKQLKRQKDVVSKQYEVRNNIYIS